ncbi:MAG: hypothetical protein WC621_05530 [Patescibacteria group bacterium]
MGQEFLSQQEIEKNLIKSEFESFYKNNPGHRFDSTDKYIEKFLDSDPAFLQSILSSTEGLRTVAEKLYERSQKRLEDNDIEIVQSPNYPFQFSTKEGLKRGKLDAPDVFTDPTGYEEFMKEQYEKTSYSGLDEEKSEKMLKSILEMYEAKTYENEAGSAMFTMILDKGMYEENKKDGRSGVLGEFVNISIPLKMLRTKIDGEIAFVRNLPGFTVDKIKELTSKILETLKSEEK